MFNHLQGVVSEKTPPTLVIEVNCGVGYALEVSMSTWYTLPEVGERVKLYTHLAVREDAHLLYGFATVEERSLFRALIKISGIGARTALSILSSMSPQDLAQAVAAQDSHLLVKVPGIGPKTAGRLILELKGKVQALSPQASSGGHADIQHALIALGYSEKDAAVAVKSLPAGIDVAEGIRQALQGLVK